MDLHDVIADVGRLSELHLTFRTLKLEMFLHHELTIELLMFLQSSPVLVTSAAVAGVLMCGLVC